MFTRPIPKLKYLFFFLFIFSIPLQKRHIFSAAQLAGAFNEWTAISLYLSDILFAAALLFWLAEFLTKCRTKSRFPQSNITYSILHITYYLLPIAILSSFSLIHAANFNLAIFRLTKLLELFLLFFFIIHNLKIQKYRHYTYAVFLTIMIIQSLIAIFQYGQQKSLGLKILGENDLGPQIIGVAKIVVAGKKIMRPYGTFPHPNVLAAFLIAAIIFCFYFWVIKKPQITKCELYGLNCHSRAGGNPEIQRNFNLDPRLARDDRKDFIIQGKEISSRIYKITLLCLIFLFTTTLILTFSRSGWFGLVIALIIFIIICKGEKSFAPTNVGNKNLCSLPGNQKNYRQKIKILLPALTIFALTTIIVSIIFWPQIAVRTTTSDSPSGDFALSNRVFLNQVAFTLISQRPWLGGGIGNFVTHLHTFAPTLPAWQLQPSHNIYLLLAAEIGIPGLLFFLLFLWNTISSGLKQILKNPEIAFFLSLLFAYLAIGLLDHYFYNLQQGMLIFWLILGLIWTISISPQKSYLTR